MEALGLIVTKIILPKVIPLKVIPVCGAVLGSTILLVAALRCATTVLGATTTTSLLVFALSAMAGELFNPFLFSPFALYTMFLFSLPPASREKFF
jgi:hypothetical protein